MILDGVFSHVENCWIELEDPLFELDGDHLPVCFSITLTDHFKSTASPDAAPSKFSFSQLSLTLFSGTLETQTSPVILLPPPTSHSELDALVTFTKKAITASMEGSMVPPPRQKTAGPILG